MSDRLFFVLKVVVYQERVVDFPRVHITQTILYVCILYSVLFLCRSIARHQTPLKSSRQLEKLTCFELIIDLIFFFFFRINRCNNVMFAAVQSKRKKYSTSKLINVLAGYVPFYFIALKLCMQILNNAEMISAS